MSHIRRRGYPSALLDDGEVVLRHQHPHWKLLISPILWTAVLTVGPALGYFLWFQDYTGMSPEARGIVLRSSGAIAGALLVVAVLVPVVKWRCEHFVLTTRHIFTRKGVLSRSGHQIPLINILNIESQETFLGRILGFGSLSMDTAASDPLVFEDVAHARWLNARLTELISGGVDLRSRLETADSLKQGTDTDTVDVSGYEDADRIQGRVASPWGEDSQERVAEEAI